MACFQIYTGNGKGKTTAAFGLSFRALGHGKKVVIVQFMKNDERYGEFLMAKKLDNIEVFQFGAGCLIGKDGPGEKDFEFAKSGFDKSCSILQDNSCDILILDEINTAVFFGLLDKQAIIEKIINRQPENIELIFTGRYAPDEFIELADLVTEMKEIKHYYTKGIQARQGIEY